MDSNRWKRPRATYAKSSRYGRPSETTARKLVPYACFPHRSRGHIFSEGDPCRLDRIPPRLDSIPCTLLSIEINGCTQSDAENSTACRTVRGEADVIWDAHPAIRTGRMPVSRNDRRDRSGDIRREQFVAAALAHRIEIVIASLLQNVLQRTRCGTRFGFIFQNLRKFKSIAIGNIDSRQLAHVRPPIL